MSQVPNSDIREGLRATAAFEAAREDLESAGSDEPQTDRLHDEVEPDSDDDWGYR